VAKSVDGTDEPATVIADAAGDSSQRSRWEPEIMHKAVISLATGLEDPEKVTVAFLVAVGAAEQGRQTLMFLTKEAVRLAVPGVSVGVACLGCPPLPDLVDRYARAGGRFLVCPICLDAKQVDKANLIGNAEVGGTVPMWQWIGDDAAVTFSY
jgi:predicted peroxiredoxin